MFDIDCDWKLASPRAKNLLKRLAGVLVYLDGAKEPVGSAGSFVGIDWSGFYFDGASDIFCTQLVYIAAYVFYLVGTIFFDSEPLASNRQRHACLIFRPELGISIEVRYLLKSWVWLGLKFEVKTEITTDFNHG